jgi:hypothetical protein
MTDGSWLLLIYKGRAFIPTMAQTEAGFKMGIEPVEVVDVNERDLVEQAVIRAVNRGNPKIPTPAPGSFPKDPILKYAKVKSIAVFDRSSISWKLSRSGGTYEIVPYRLGNDGKTYEDRQRAEAVAGDVGIESVVHRLVERATSE